jgi:hypothetical protein
MSELAPVPPYSVMMPTPSSTPFVRRPVVAEGAAVQPRFRESALAAGPVVGKEYVRAMEAFLTNDWATVRARHRL